jgi:O-antigen/teichoic acid export membrane protein
MRPAAQKSDDHGAPDVSEVVSSPAVPPAATAVRPVTSRHVTSGFGWLALSQYSNRLLGFVSTLILAKLLTPADFGLVAVASMVIEIMQLFRDMGLSEAVISSRREDRKALDTAHTVLVGYNVLLFGLVAAASPLVAWFYRDQSLILIVILLSSNLVINSLRLVPVTLIRRNLEFRKLMLTDLGPSFVSAIVGIVLALVGFGVWSLVLKTMVQSVLTLVLVQLVVPYRPRFAFERSAARDLFGYGKFIVGSSMLFVALYNIDRLFVSRIAGLAAFGAFDFAARIADMPTKQFSGLVGAVMFPVYSAVDRSGAVLRPMFLRTLKYTASITFPAAVGLALFGPALVDRFYGPRWAALGPLLQLLSIYAALRSTSSIIHDLYKATGRPDLMQRAALAKLLAVGILGAPAVYYFGAPGIAGLLVAVYTTVLFWELARVSTLLEMPISMPLRRLGTPAALAAILMPGVYALMRSFTPLTSLWQLSVAMLVCGGAYLAVLAGLDGEVLRDLRKIRESFRPVRPASSLS